MVKTSIILIKKAFQTPRNTFLQKAAIELFKAIKGEKRQFKIICESEMVLNAITIYLSKGTKFWGYLREFIKILIDNKNTIGFFGEIWKMVESKFEHEEQIMNHLH